MNRRYFIASVLIFFMFVLSCKKYDNAKDNIPGEGYLRGRIFIADSLNGDFIPAPKGEVIVMISEKDTGADFVLSMTPDTNGYFLFQHLDKKISYSIFAEIKIDSIIYYGRLSVQPDKNDLVFVLTPKYEGQSIINYLVQDPFGQRVKDCNVCVYSNFSHANDTACNGSIWTGTTNIFGKVSKTALSPGLYIANFKYDKAGIRYIKKDTFSIAADTIFTRIIKLETAPVVKLNTITYIVKDSLGGIVEGCDVCVFTSVVLANDSCENSTITAKTDNTGKASIKGVSAGTCYAFFRYSKINPNLKARDTIYNLLDTTQYSRNIILR